MYKVNIAYKKTEQVAGQLVYIYTLRLNVHLFWRTVSDCFVPSVAMVISLSIIAVSDSITKFKTDVKKLCSVH